MVGGSPDLPCNDHTAWFFMRVYTHRNLVGHKSGRLTVLQEVGRTPVLRDYFWLCKCQCGNTKIIRGQSLIRNRTRSCGCLQRETGAKNALNKSTHKHSNTPIYRSWSSMIQRCTNPHNPKYRIYGARGITVCEEWFDFSNFLRDMGEKPTGLTLGRIDNDGPYCKTNCEWQTHKTQANNKTCNRIVEYNGQKHTISQWAEILGMNFVALRMRLHRKWSVNKSFNTPLRRW